MNKLKRFETGFENSVTGNPVTMSNSLAKNVDYTISGNATQSGTPSPSAPISVKGCGDKTENLFDRSTEILNYYLNPTTGQPQSEGNSAYCDYFSVKPNTTYTVSFVYKHSGYYVRIHGYDSSKTWTSLIWSQSTGGLNTRVSYTITTGANDYYIRISYPKLDEDIEFEEGSTAPSSSLTAQCVGIQSGTNYAMFNRSAFSNASVGTKVSVTVSGTTYQQEVKAIDSQYIYIENRTV